MDEDISQCYSGRFPAMRSVLLTFVSILGVDCILKHRKGDEEA